MTCWRQWGARDSSLTTRGRPVAASIEPPPTPGGQATDVTGGAHGHVVVHVDVLDQVRVPMDPYPFELGRDRASAAGVEHRLVHPRRQEVHMAIDQTKLEELIGRSPSAGSG